MDVMAESKVAPSELYTESPSTLVGWIDYHARRTPTRIAIEQGDTTLTYSDLSLRIDRLTNVLLEHGIQDGARIAVLARNDHRFFEIQYACARTGAIMVPLNWRLSNNELSDIIQDFQPKALFHDAHHHETAQHLSHLQNISTIFSWSDQGAGSYEQAVSQASDLRHEVQTTSDTPWIIIYTSGTTGRPKGVVHTIGSVRANLENSMLCGDIDSKTVSLTTLPMFHVAGLHLFSGDVLRAGGRLLIMKAFEAEEVLQRLWDETIGVTHFSAVPTIYQLMTKTQTYRSATPRPFLAAAGGSPVPTAIIDTWRDKGADFIKVYGASEAGSTVITTSPETKHPESTLAGLHAASVEVEIRDADGQPISGNQTGELWIRGQSLMKHYWNRPDATDEAIDESGWYRTGDAARIDDTGMLHIVDRIKDMYISGGENVYPAEVENTLYTHPAILLVSIIGIPDEKWGEVGRAFIVLKPQAQLSAEELRTWCREHMAAYKIPASFEFVEELPRNGTGKILKTALRQARS